MNQTELEALLNYLLKFPNSRDIENQSKKIRESSGLYCLICYF